MTLPGISFAMTAPVLRLLATADASGEVLDVTAAAAELGVLPDELLDRLGEIRARGLARLGLIEGRPPILLNAGRQFLTVRGSIDDAVLCFLPRVIDDLHARRAVLRGGALLVNEFRVAVLSGAAVSHAGRLVPPAFAAAVDERLAIDLFAASVALMSRLSEHGQAGCVAEAIMTVRLMERARDWLAIEVADGRLSEASMEPAVAELDALFDRSDDDVLRMFAMRETDQGVDHWFRPYGWTAPTGYLA